MQCALSGLNSKKPSHPCHCLILIALVICKHYCLLSTQSHIKPADGVRDDIAKLKEDMAKLVQALTPKGGNGFH